LPVTNSLSDPELITLLRQGDRDAFTEIYNRYNGLLYIFVHKRLQNREEAKDIIHELFLTLWNNRESLMITGDLSPYLYSAKRNRIINVITHQKVADRYIDSFQHYLDNVSSDTTDHLIRHNELKAFIEAEIAALTPRMRLVFELSRKTNLTRKEIAERLNISEETVKSQMHGALKILKMKLGPIFFMLF